MTIWFIYTVFCWQALSSFKLRLLWIVPWTLLYEHVFWYICTHTIGYISSSGTTGMVHIPLLLIYFLLYFWPSIRDHFLFAWIPFRIGLLGQKFSLFLSFTSKRYFSWVKFRVGSYFLSAHWVCHHWVIFFFSILFYFFWEVIYLLLL